MRLRAIDAVKALVVELIRQLWDRNFYRGNQALIAIHRNWLPYWVELRTRATMRDVDEQVDVYQENIKKAAPLLTEGPTNASALGGFMRLSSPHKRTNGSKRSAHDPV